MRKGLGEFEQMILLALIRLRGNAYGMTIRREIAQIAEREVAIGAVYTVLQRLERKGFVSSRIGDPTVERGGRAKRYFKIEAPGEHALSESLKAIERMTEGLEPARIT